MNVRALFEDALLVCLYTPSTEYTDETPIQNLGDSLDIVNVIAHIENIVDKDLGKIDFSTLHTVKDVILLLEQRISGQTSQSTSNK